MSSVLFDHLILQPTILSSLVSQKSHNNYFQELKARFCSTMFTVFYIILSTTKTKWRFKTTMLTCFTSAFSSTASCWAGWVSGSVMMLFWPWWWPGWQLVTRWQRIEARKGWLKLTNFPPRPFLRWRRTSWGSGGNPVASIAALCVNRRR